MPRQLRLDIGGKIYHCLNRAVGKQQIFFSDADYKSFEKILEEIVDIVDVGILAYCVMPNHFHLVLRTENDGDLSNFMKRLSVTHTQRYRVAKNTVGEGPIYQGRYKSFIVQDNEYLLTLLRYVERNPFTANLIKNPLLWRYSSLYRRHKGTEKQKQLLHKWTIDEPSDYISMLKQPIGVKELERLKKSENKGVPYGNDVYVSNIIEKYKLHSTLRKTGKPKETIIIQ